MKLQVRLAEPHEAPIVEQIARDSLIDLDSRLPNTSGALAFLGGRPVGSVQFTVLADYLTFHHLSILPEIQGQGIGRKIIAWLEDYARTNVLNEVHHVIRMSLVQNWQLYHSLGYETLSVVPHSDGADIVVTMVKRLVSVPPQENDGKEILERFITSLQEEEPTAIAILLLGSLAKGKAGPFSDIHLRVVTDGEPTVRDRVAFAERPDGRVLRLSIGSRSRTEILQSAEDPEQWPRLVETYETAQTLWEKPSATSALRLRAQIAARRPRPKAYAAKSSHYLQRLLEYVAQLKNAVAMGEEQGVRRSAARLADACWRLLRPLNPVRTATGPSISPHNTPQFTVAPEGFDEDLAACLGAAEGPLPVHTLAWRALHLAEGTVRIIETNLPAMGLSEELERAVSDGVVARLIKQEFGWSWGELPERPARH